MTRVSRWGTPLYWPSSTRLGSTRISRTSSGVARIRIDVTRALMHEDLPAPVAPAMSTCGSSSSLSRRVVPLMSLPSADLQRVGIGFGLGRSEDVAEGDQ